MFKHVSLTLYGLCLWTSAFAHAQEIQTRISIPLNLTSHPLVKDVYGYSIEPVWLDDYIQTDLTTNLMQLIADITGKPPPIRVGGNTADQTYLLRDDDDAEDVSLASPNPTNATSFNITASWFDTWADYFPNGTDLIYTLNFANNRSSWANAVAQAEAAYAAFGSKLTMLELGNEIDHFAAKSWRNPDWGVDEFSEQWSNVSAQIVDSPWYQKLDDPPKFQAAVFADPPWVPDQHDWEDDFDIINATEAGHVDPELMETYSVHMYPQSTCDTERWYRMRLDLLSNHTTVWQNVSQYIPQVEAAHALGKPLVNGETNSVSCSGHSGISDTLGAALWAVDYVFTHISIGFQKVYFHLGAQSEYSSFTPLPYEYEGEDLESGIRAGFYAHYFISHVINGSDNYSISALPTANSSDLSGFGIFSSGGGLRKLVFLDMGIWNGTDGLSNPSTISATDSTSHMNGTRPTRQMRVNVRWRPHSEVRGIRLSGPGTNAKSQISVGNVTFDHTTGAASNELETESFAVNGLGELAFTIPRAGGILLELVDGDEGGDGVESVPPEAAASRFSGGCLHWMYFLVVACLLM